MRKVYVVWECWGTNKTLNRIASTLQIANRIAEEMNELDKNVKAQYRSTFRVSTEKLETE